MRHHRTLKLTALWTLAAWAILTTLILSSSFNNGAAFGLPVLVILILLAAAVLGQMSWRLLPALGVVLAGILVVGWWAKRRVTDGGAGGLPIGGGEMGAAPSVPTPI